MNQIDLQKKSAGEKAATFIEDGMTIGLGSGSTIYWVMKKLGEFVSQGMNLRGIPSSKRTEEWAKEFNITLIDFSNVDFLDVAIDGADEIDPQFNLIKGGGGSLVREKIVDSHAKRLIIVADESKLVSKLGKFPLPVEVLPFGWETTATRISKLGVYPVLRMKEEAVFVSDNGNYILDCPFDSINDVARLHSQLKMLVGVIETGLFINMTDTIIIGGENDVRVKSNF